MSGRVHMHDDPRNVAYADRVRWAWRDAGAVNFGGSPIELAVVAQFPRPKTHWRRDGALSSSESRASHKTSRPDLSNIIKAVEDALNGLAWTDDSQIVAYGRPRKVWTVEPGDPACMYVSIRSLELT